MTNPDVSDEDQVRQLDEAWNRAYLTRDTAALASILAEDWVAFTPEHHVIGRAQLIEGQRSAPEGAKISFEEGTLHVFGDTAVTTGSTEVTAADVYLHQRFTRIYAKRGGRWEAVAVQVVPIHIVPVHKES